MENNVKSRTMRFIRYKGLNMKEFEERCDLSTGYVTSMRKSFGSDKLNNVLNAFPELNREWLLYGEGEMLKPQPPSQTANGDGNTQVAGNGNHVNGEKLIEEIAAQRRMAEKSQQQIDRLLSIIERMQQQQAAAFGAFPTVTPQQQGT